MIDTLVLGLSTDPVIRWYFPQSHQFLVNAPIFLDLIGGEAFEHNTAYHSDEFACSALWLPPNVHPDVDGIKKLLTEALDGFLLEEASAMEEQFEKFVPSEPCWHLAIIAVDPALTGNGHGSKMLEHTLRICDEDKKPVYLESTNRANLTLYQRYGFELLGEIQVGSSPIVYPMMREPR